jgi:DNA-binding response OmpR family regulator/DNA-binding CsgD family transcriptional regulator
MDKKLLLVDDDPMNLQVLFKMVSKLWPGAEYFQASNGTKAVEVAQKTQPDIILMDWDMPGMNGINATRALKANEKTKDIPVVITTGVMLSTLDMKTALEAGAADFIKKPIDEHELSARVGNIFRMIQYQKDKQQAQTKLAAEQEKHLEDMKAGLMAITMEARRSQKINENQLAHIDRSLQMMKNQRERLLSLKQKILEEMEDSRSSIYLKDQLKALDQGFNKRIKAKHPGLTGNDLTLCSYIRLNMDTQQIADVTGIEPASVRRQRSRLRRKLGLDDGADLTAFLNRV